MRAIRPSRFRIFPAALALLLVTTWFYALSLGFGFMWDDPLWYGRVVGKSFVELISPMPDFQFYRPATMLYNRLFLNPDATFSAPLMHAAQVGWHLLNVALVVALCRRLRLGSWSALAAGALVAWYPFSYQAVAWAAPQQPMALALQNGAWLAYLGARNMQRRRWLAGLSLLLYLTALFVQESTTILAVLPLLIEWVLRRRCLENTQATTPGRRPIPWLALLYPLIAAAFGVLWLQVPRQASITGLSLERKVAAYLAQGFAFPLLGWPGAYATDPAIAPETVLGITGLTLGGLLLLSHRAGRGRQALLGLLWALLGIAPSAIGLQYNYVRLGPRLLTYAAPGAALLWACALLPTDHPTARRLWRTIRAVMLALILLQCGRILADFQRLYTAGAAHIAELVRSGSQEDERLLFVNFPDRYALERAPYPLGYWGLTLAPASVDLGAFPAMVTGRAAQTISCSSPWIDAEAREAGPYRIDMRGSVAPPDQLYRLAQEMDGVYLSRCHPDGSFALQWAGALIPQAPAPDCALARFGDILCLQEAQVDPQADRLDVTLTWLFLAPAQTHDTIFAHLGQPGSPPVTQADGDTWLGLIPLSTWQPGDTVREMRSLPLTREITADSYVVSVGVYNRITGERLPAATPAGDPLPDDALVIHHCPQIEE